MAWPLHKMMNGVGAVKSITRDSETVAPSKGVCATRPLFRAPTAAIHCITNTPRDTSPAEWPLWQMNFGGENLPFICLAASLWRGILDTFFHTATEWSKLQAENFQLFSAMILKQCLSVICHTLLTYLLQEQKGCLFVIAGCWWFFHDEMPAFRVGCRKVPSCPSRPELNQYINTWFLQEDMWWQCLWGCYVLVKWPRESAASLNTLQTTRLLLLSVGDSHIVRMC